MLRLLITMLLKTSVDWKNDYVLQSVGVSITQQYCRKPQSTNCTCLCTKWSKPIFQPKKVVQVHVVTWDLSQFRLGVWKQSSRHSGCTPAMCIVYSPSKVDKRRFAALSTAHLTRYSKCQLCKWSTVCLSSHISWVIALWQAYLFWCSLHTSIAYPATSTISQAGYKVLDSIFALCSFKDVWRFHWPAILKHISFHFVNTTI